jgi:hypothetical protein
MPYLKNSTNAAPNPSFQALVAASEGSEDDQAVFMSCYAVLFFAVPSRGLDNSSLMSMVKGQPNEDLVRNLSGSSQFLSLLHDRFSKCFTLDDSKILCIFETLRTPTVVVSFSSKF